MLKYFLLFFSLTLFLCSCEVQRKAVYRGEIPPQTKDSTHLRLANRIDDFVESLAPQTFNGVVIVEKEGRLILGKGYGYARREEQLPFSVHTLSNTANLAMQLTAAAILKLNAREALRLQDSLPLFFEGVPPEKQGISLEQLLQHTSGLPRELAFPLEARTKSAFLEAVWQAPMDFRPGEDYQFSPAAYRLLAAVVEAASGEDYRTFIRKELLRPAKMKQTTYLREELKGLPLAKSRHGGEEEGLLSGQYLAPELGLWHLMGSSGLLSNVEDVFRWEHMLLRGKLLPLEVREELWSSQHFLPEGAQAYGWELRRSSRNTPVLVHESRERGFFCQLLYLPEERVSLVILANQLNLQVEQLGEQLVRMVTSPQFVPSPLPYVAENLVRLPLEEEAAQVRTLVSFIQGDYPADIPGLMAETYSPELIDKTPERIHFSALNGLRDRLQGARLEHVRQDWPFYYFTFFAPKEVQWYGLKVGVEPQSPHRITSIGLEVIEAIN